MDILPQKQLSLADIYFDCQNIFETDQHRFLSLLEENLNLDTLIPGSFYRHYYSATGRPREFELHSMIRALLLQKIFSIPSDTLLLIFLKFSAEIRAFCGFKRVPDASRFTRFKQEFLLDLQSFFDHLVDVTEPICQAIDPQKAAMSIFDTSGIETYVTENNPKYFNRIMIQLKAFKKANQLPDSYDPHKAAYKMMPTHATAKPEIKQFYINGHFCYVYKFGMIANGLGIVQDITFYNRDFLAAHPDIVVEKKSDSLDEDKSLSDSKALLPVLTDFFNKHPLIHPGVFLGDAAFDTIPIYSGLFNDLHFNRAYIPLNRRSNLEYPDFTINRDGIPCCPNDPSLPMMPEGNTSHLQCGIPTLKFVCPKMKWVKCSDGKHRRRHHCDHPCTTSLCGRMVYIYPEKNLRTYPGTIRGTDEWVQTYKIRGYVEQTINQFKDSFCVANRRTQNGQTVHADLLLSGIAQLLTVILADSIRQHQYIRSLKPLIA